MTHKEWIALLGPVIGTFVAVLDIQITNSSLFQISGDTGHTTEEGSWISTSYLIGETVTIGLTPWFAKVTVCWYLVASTVLFPTFSCLCGSPRVWVR